MQERGVFVDHSSINRWAIRFLPLLEKVFRIYKRLVGGNWRMDETYIKVKGAWHYLYRKRSINRVPCAIGAGVIGTAKVRWRTAAQRLGSNAS